MIFQHINCTALILVAVTTTISSSAATCKDEQLALIVPIFQCTMNIMAIHPFTFFFVSLLLLLECSTALIELRSSAITNLVSASELQDFLSRPIHWPDIVASSNSVSSTEYNVSEPLQVGSTVQEYFGMNLLSVTWTCTRNEPGSFLVESTDGLSGIAKQCQMKFDVSTTSENSAKVVLTMGYDPVSPIALVATPVLVLDNWMALQVLLPMALKEKLSS